MKAQKCKPSAQFAYNYITINVLSKCSNIISHRSSAFEGRHNDNRSSKIDTSIIHLRRLTHLSTHRSSKIKGGNIVPATQHRTDIPTIRHRILSTSQRRSIVIPKIPRGIYVTIHVTLDEGTHAHTRTYIYIRQQPHTCYSYVIYAYLYCVLR